MGTSGTTRGTPRLMLCTLQSTHVDKHEHMQVVQISKNGVTDRLIWSVPHPQTLPHATTSPRPIVGLRVSGLLPLLEPHPSVFCPSDCTTAPAPTQAPG